MIDNYFVVHFLIAGDFRNWAIINTSLVRGAAKFTHIQTTAFASGAHKAN